MKKIYKSIMAAVALATCLIPLNAQKIYKGEIDVPSKLTQQGDSLYLTMDINLDQLKVDRQRSLLLTPYLSNSEQTHIFPQILINGKTRHKAYKRGVALDKKMDTSMLNTVVVSPNQKETIHYTQTIPFREWMKNADLYIEQDLCGCAGHRQELYTDRLIPVDLEEIIVPEPEPEIAIIQKEIIHKEDIELYLEFPVGDMVIHPDFKNNKSVLDELDTRINKLINDTNIDISKIEIYGYASPEGKTEFNKTLSEGRAESLRRYLNDNYARFRSYNVEVIYGGEDWKKLEELVAESSMAEKEDILYILRETLNPETRKGKLKSFKGGAPYQKMLRDMYPKIRRVTLHAYYTIKDIVEEEVVIETK